MELPEERREVLTAKARLCPDFVIELQSPSDRPRPLREKMQEYLANGAQLGWLIDSERRSVAIYRPDREVEMRNTIESIAGEGPVTGFCARPFLYLESAGRITRRPAFHRQC